MKKKSKTAPKIKRNQLLKNYNGNSEKEILKDFIIGKTLGKGTFGKVKLGIHKITGEKVNILIIFIYRLQLK